MPKKQLKGTVAALCADKTIKVALTAPKQHGKYNKVTIQKYTVLVHDPANAAAVGQEVTIIETRPISKSKRWTVLQAL
jgi:small subunit ribosomal protein S17